MKEEQQKAEGGEGGKEAQTQTRMHIYLYAHAAQYDVHFLSLP